MKYVPLPHHDLPVLIYQSIDKPPIHVVHTPPPAKAPPSYQPPKQTYQVGNEENGKIYVLFGPCCFRAMQLDQENREKLCVFFLFQASKPKPKPAASSYAPPKPKPPPPSSYGAPKKPSGSYGPPKKPTGSYGPPKKPTTSYGPPKKPSNSYGPLKKPTSSYGPPKKPSSSYGPPKKP